MGIEKINNIGKAATAQSQPQSTVTNRVYLGDIKDSTSFTGAGNAAKPLNEALLELMPKKIQKMLKMHKGMGEIQNQLINALGTGIVAPMFIKFNPISDTDKDTRTYTAWRQPVSAVLAVGTQCAIVIPFNALVRYNSDIGRWTNSIYNNSLTPSDNYLRALIKADNPGKNFTKKEMAEKLKEYRKIKQNDLIKMIEEDKIVFNRTKWNGKTESFTKKMPDKEFRELFNETIERVIKEEEIEKQHAVLNKRTKKLERAIFYHDNHKDSLKLFNKINDKIQEKLQHVDTSTFKKYQAGLDKDFDEIIKELKKEASDNPAKKGVNEQLIKIVKELKTRNIDKDSASLTLLSKKVNSLIETVQIIANKTTTEDVMKYVDEKITERTNAIDEVIGTLKEILKKSKGSGISVRDAQRIIDEKIEKSKKGVYKKLKAKGKDVTNIENTEEMAESLAGRLKQKLGSVAEGIAKCFEDHNKANIDGLKRWTGLAVSLAILPLTCWMLNKIYPWFMDLAFPELSNKNKGSKPDAVDNVDKKAEVK